MDAVDPIPLAEHRSNAALALCLACMSFKGDKFDMAQLMSLVVDTAWGDEIVPWAQSLIDEALLTRKRVRKGVVRFPDCEDRAMLAACIRGLVLILDGGMEMRRAA